MIQFLTTGSLNQFGYGQCFIILVIILLLLFYFLMIDCFSILIFVVILFSFENNYYKLYHILIHRNQN